MNLYIYIYIKTVLESYYDVMIKWFQINPQHNIPGFVDGDFHMNESRAIGAYLANAYAKDKSIYPEEPKARAKVDQMMYFDMGQLYKAFGDCFVSNSE